MRVLSETIGAGGAFDAVLALLPFGNAVRYANQSPGNMSSKSSAVEADTASALYCLPFFLFFSFIISITANISVNENINAPCICILRNEMCFLKMEIRRHCVKGDGGKL
jgi:hypothetical protein